MKISLCRHFSGYSKSFQYYVPIHFRVWGYYIHSGIDIKDGTNESLFVLKKKKIIIIIIIVFWGIFSCILCINPKPTKSADSLMADYSTVLLSRMVVVHQDLFDLLVVVVTLSLYLLTLCFWLCLTLGCIIRKFFEHLGLILFDSFAMRKGRSSLQGWLCNSSCYDPSRARQ